MKPSLAGIRVLDLTRLLPGPFMTMVLSDMGAQVIKVEPPGAGDYMRQIPPLGAGGMSGRYLAVNRGKRSIVLDLKSDTGRDALLRMCESADVVVESFRPGVMEKLGLGFDLLCERNSKLILCSISGYGQSGSMRNRAGHDLNYAALSGVLAMGGSKDGAPAMPGTQVADLAGGALWSCTAVLGALVGRDTVGAQHLDISMTEGSLSLMAAEIGNLACSPQAPRRGTETLNGGLACYSIYPCADARYLAVAALEPKFWMAFNEAIGREGNPGEALAKPDAQEALREELAAILITKSRDEWMTIFDTIDCCVEPVLELEELESHPLHRSRQVFFEIPGDSEQAPLSQVRLPIGTPNNLRRPPKMGEHTEEILREFGFSEEEMAGLGVKPRPRAR